MSRAKIEPREYTMGEALAVLSEEEVRLSVSVALLNRYRIQESITGRMPDGAPIPRIQKSPKADI